MLDAYIAALDHILTSHQVNAIVEDELRRLKAQIEADRDSLSE